RALTRLSPPAFRAADTPYGSCETTAKSQASPCGAARPASGLPFIVRRDSANNSERPGPPEGTARVLPAFGARNKTFALSLFPGCLACSSNGFCLLASLALGRFFIGLAALHLAKNPLALHLLL